MGETSNKVRKDIETRKLQNQFTVVAIPMIFLK